jgi:hypothetical protein
VTAPNNGLIDLEELLGGGGPASAPATPAPAPAPFTATATTPGQQAAPGTTPPTKQPQAVAMPTVVDRQALIVQGGAASPPGTVKLDAKGDFDTNLALLLAKDLELAQHDRQMAISLFQIHLERAEVLDGLQLSMPVAQVIGDNTGATLKSLELAMKASERVRKVAELLVDARRNDDAASINALKLQIASKKGDNGWGDETPGG